MEMEFGVEGNMVCDVGSSYSFRLQGVYAYEIKKVTRKIPNGYEDNPLGYKCGGSLYKNSNRKNKVFNQKNEINTRTRR